MSAEMDAAITRMESALHAIDDWSDAGKREVFWAWQQVKRNLGYDATLARFQ